MGIFQAEQPKRGKVSNRPSRVIGPVGFGTPFPMTSFTQDTAQPASNETIFHTECRTVAVLEVLKPAPQRPVHIGDDAGHALSRGLLGLRPDRVSELLAALVARPASAGFEVIAEEVKATLALVNQPGLGRMQRQAGCCRPLLHRGQGRDRFRLGSTHHHEVVRVAHHLEASLGHQMIERVEKDVA